MMAEEQLKYELDAEDGSFLLSLRTELRWDKQAFRSRSVAPAITSPLLCIM
ncbi:MAG: hypothetical protein GDA56_20565 [Hormoscilla sp. GM7CHS1pb]|nr:hypothetical protein [Hormoscilla sp. GM7CHS1pb]